MGPTLLDLGGKKEEEKEEETKKRQRKRKRRETQHTGLDFKVSQGRSPGWKPPADFMSCLPICLPPPPPPP